MTITEYITPRRDCRFCHGTGTVTDWVDYGSTVIPMPSLCDCVLEQVKSDSSDIEIVLEEEVAVSFGSD